MLNFLLKQDRFHLVQLRQQETRQLLLAIELVTSAFKVLPRLILIPLVDV